jgi:hypothetical protein
VSAENPFSERNSRLNCQEKAHSLIFCGEGRHRDNKARRQSITNKHFFFISPTSTTWVKKKPKLMKKKGKTQRCFHKSKAKNSLLRRSRVGAVKVIVFNQQKQALG